MLLASSSAWLFFIKKKNFFFPLPSLNLALFLPLCKVQDRGAAGLEEREGWGELSSFLLFFFSFKAK